MNKSFIKYKKRLSVAVATAVVISNTPVIKVNAEEIKEEQQQIDTNLIEEVDENIENSSREETSQTAENIDQTEDSTIEDEANEVVNEEVVDQNISNIHSEEQVIEDKDEEVIEKNIRSNGYIKNEYIECAIDGGGRFSIGTTGGNPNNPNDDKKTLLYGHPDYPTSYTTIHINGTSYQFEQENTVYNNHNKHVSTMQIDNILITQEISIDSTNKDMVNISYSAKNIGNKSESLGLRIMMDTMLADNDYAPFRVAGKAVNTEMELSGGNIPQFWQAFDDVENPTVVAQGNIFRGSNRPSKIQFANYGRLSSQSWGYNVDTNSYIGDSALAITWDDKTLNPGQELKFSTQYGVGEYSKQNIGELLATLAGTDKIDMENDEYIDETFEVSSIIKNNKNESVKNVKVTLNLDEGLVLEDPSKKVVTYDELVSGQEENLMWKVKLDKDSYTKGDRNLSYSITVEADGMEPDVIERKVFVPGKSTAKEVIVVDETIMLENSMDLEKLKEKIKELLKLIDEQGRNLYDLVEERTKKENLEDGSELYTIVIQELEYDVISRALSKEARVKKEYVIKIKLSKNLVATLSGNNNNNNSNSNSGSNNKPSKPNNNNSTNKKPNTNNIATGDGSILGYIGLGVTSAVILFKRRKGLK